MGEAVSGKGGEGFLYSIVNIYSPSRMLLLTSGVIQSKSPNTFFRSGHKNSLHHQSACPCPKDEKVNIRRPLIPQRCIENM